MLPTLDRLLGVVSSIRLGSREGEDYHPYQNGLPASEACFSPIR